MEWHSDMNDVTVRIDHDRCYGAAEGVEACPTDVYALVGGKAHAEDVDECIECCACDGVCPADAIWHSACVEG